jgi:hypothetical protein
LILVMQKRKRRALSCLDAGLVLSPLHAAGKGFSHSSSSPDPFS